jgi:hypothetical protein
LKESKEFLSFSKDGIKIL